MLTSFTDYSCVGNTGFGGSSSGKHYPLPFLDYTNTSVPRNFAELLDWSEYVYMSGASGLKEMFSRKYNYFNTDITATAIDSDKQSLDDGDAREFEELLQDKLMWPNHVTQLWDNTSIYGQDFISVVAPITRYLRCPVCSRYVEFETFANMDGSDFGYRQGKFVGRCQSVQCRREKRGTTELTAEDMRIKDPEKFTIKHWPVREMALDYFMWSDTTQIYWRIPEEYKRQVLSGDLKTWPRLTSAYSMRSSRTCCSSSKKIAFCMSKSQLYPA